MSLPFFLPYNIVSIYGIGNGVGLAGIVQPEGFLWGTIDAVSLYDIQWASPGQSVLFKDENVQCKLAYAADNTSYTLIKESKLEGYEIPPP